MAREAFAMPSGMAIRYDRPDPAIAEFITGYHVYATTDQGAQVDWFLPGNANVRLSFGSERMAIRIGAHRFDPLPAIGLYGPTSRAMEATTHGGMLVGFGITALGWARLARRPATDVHNRIVPLGGWLGAGFADQLAEGFDALTDEHGLKAWLDRLLIPMLAEPSPDEPLIRAFLAMTLHDGPVDIAGAAEQLDVPTHALRRMAQRYFGMTPKLLLRRTRFLRSIVRLLLADDPLSYNSIDPAYFDASHFLRDAHAFLGMTPRQFIALDKPFLDASLRAHAAVLGAPVQALHSLPAPPLADG